MLARLDVTLPFAFIVPYDAQFSSYGYEDQGYRVQIYPPVKSDQPIHGTVADEALINDDRAFLADALRIDFAKQDFDRRAEVECDPQYCFIKRTISLFLRKVRFMTRGFQITPVDFPQAPWRLQYLNDDGTALETAKGLVRERGALAFKFSWIVLTPRHWNDIRGLAVDYAPPEWDSLYLDAVAALPAIGPAIVLAYTCLEVFVSCVLDALAAANVAPPQLWYWVNHRDPLKMPAVEEQFDGLLRLLVGCSLKENRTLWDAFRNLRTARNTFVHSGVAEIGKVPVTEGEARRLVEHAAQIISFIRVRLPDELRWTEYEHKVSVRISKRLLAG